MKLKQKETLPDADWKGTIRWRLGFKNWRFYKRWGRWCYKTDCMGNVLASWWEEID